MLTLTDKQQPRWKALLIRAVRSSGVCYAISVLTVVLATLLTLMLWKTALSRNPYVLFYAAVMVSAWVGGIGPGLVTTALAVWALDFFFIPSFVSPVGWDGIVQVGAFSSVAILISSLNARRNHALLTAENANRAKDQFLAVLSHELRTPLTPALMAAGSLESLAPLPRHAREDLAIIRRNIELEARLIDDLLDLTRISRGKMQLDPKPTNVRCLLQQALEICQSDAHRKKLRVLVYYPPEETYILGDPARLHQIFWNLLKNAVKFTPEEGEVRVRSSVDPELGELCVEVSDSGIGIELSLMPHIFDAFNQGDTSTTRIFGGLGLGLAISKALVDAQGGTLVGHSDGKGKGATFTVRFPTIPAPMAQPSSALQPSTNAHVALRLLLVEDHSDTAKAISRLLRSASYQVCTADSVGSALKRAEESRFDLVVSDLGLPDGSGLELMRELKGRFGLRGIALSGYGMEDDIRRSREAGFIAHLTKPVQFSTLQAMIEQVAPS